MFFATLALPREKSFAAPLAPAQRPRVQGCPRLSRVSEGVRGCPMVSEGCPRLSKAVQGCPRRLR
eukprot:10746484-Karenia_brevis.AAC.1